MEEVKHWKNIIHGEIAMGDRVEKQVFLARIPLSPPMTMNIHSSSR